jgi:hypothetical protein
MANSDRPDQLPPELVNAIRASEGELPGERGALDRAMRWMGVPPAHFVHAGPAPVLAVDQFAWTSVSSKTEATTATGPTI